MSSPASFSHRGDRQAREKVLLALVEQCGRRDEAALAKLYDETGQYVYGVALSVLRNQPDAEEVTLDVFNQVWRAANSYSSDRGNVTSWLIMMARSRAIDRIRSTTTRLKSELPFEAERPAGGMAIWNGLDPEQHAARNEQRARIERAMAALAPDQRAAVELAFFGGFTHHELAERLGEPLGTVKTRIRSGMTKLRELLYAETGAGAGAGAA